MGDNDLMDAIPGLVRLNEEGILVVDRETQWDHRDLLPSIKPLDPFDQRKLDHFTRIFGIIYDDLRMKPHRELELKAITRDLEITLQRFLSDHSHLELFGSSVNGFGSNDCDLDLCLTFDDNLTGENVDTERIIEDIASILQRHGPIDKKSILAITTAKVPIVKFVYDLNGSKFNCDISLYNVLAKSNTAMLRAYTEIDPRVSILGFIVKFWAKICEIGDASKGSLSSYAYTLMTLHYLQSEGVIPVLQEILEPGVVEKPEIKVDEWNVYFFKNIRDLNSNLWPQINSNRQCIALLFLGFLDFYSKYNYEDQVIACRQKGPVTKEFKEKNGNNWRWKLINIEDPFLLDHNLGQGLTQQMGVYIRSAFIMSRNHLAKILSDPTPIPPNAAPDHQSKIFFNPVRLTTGKVPTGRGCRICGGIGHKRDQCPNPKNEKKIRACFQCGDPNHLIYDCPERYRLERMRRLDSRMRQPINHHSINLNRNMINHHQPSPDSHLQRHHNNNFPAPISRDGNRNVNQRRIQPNQLTTITAKSTNMTGGNSLRTEDVQILSRGAVTAVIAPVKKSGKSAKGPMVEMSSQTTRDDYDPRKPKDENEKDGNLDDSVAEDGGNKNERNTSGQKERKPRNKIQTSPPQAMSPAGSKKENSQCQQQPPPQLEHEIHPLLQKLLITPTKPNQPTFGTVNSSSAKQLFNQTPTQMPQSVQQLMDQKRPQQSAPHQQQQPQQFSFLSNFGSSLGHVIHSPQQQQHSNPSNQQTQNLANLFNNHQSSPMTSAPRPSFPHQQQQPVSYPPMLDVLFNRHPSPSSVISTPRNLHQHQPPSSDPRLFANRNSNNQQPPSPFAGVTPQSFPKLPGQESPAKKLFDGGSDSGSSMSTLDSFGSYTAVHGSPVLKGAPPGFSKIVATGPPISQQQQRVQMGPGRYRPPGSDRPPPQNCPEQDSGPGRGLSPTSRGRGRGMYRDRN